MFILFNSINLEHDTNPDKPKYRPPFLDHFDRKKPELMIGNVISPTSLGNAQQFQANGEPQKHIVDSPAGNMAPMLNNQLQQQLSNEERQR